MSEISLSYTICNFVIHKIVFRRRQKVKIIKWVRRLNENNEIILFSGNHNSENLITTASASTDLRNEMETADQQELNSGQMGGEGRKTFTNHSDGGLTPNVLFTLNLLLFGRFVLTN